MIKVENIEVFNFDGAIRGMRNPLNSWDKSDSKFNEICIDAADCCAYGIVVNKVGKNDLDLMRRLYKAGTPHRKYLRQIFVSMDITAPLYWWKEMDQYKIGTTSNSCSTMHTIHKRDLTLDDFSHEHLSKELGMIKCLEYTITMINSMIALYRSSNDKDAWWQIIQLLPTSFNQKRTITMNYENVFNILRQRQGHKLDEWNSLCDTLKNLPYVREIGGIDDGE